MVMKIKLSIVEDKCTTNILGFINLRQVVTYIDLHVALESQSVFDWPFDFWHKERSSSHSTHCHKSWLMLTCIMELQYLSCLGFCHRPEDVALVFFVCIEYVLGLEGDPMGIFQTCNFI